MSLVEYFAPRSETRVPAHAAMVGFRLSEDANALCFANSSCSVVRGDVVEAVMQLEEIVERRFGAGPEPLIVSAHLYGVQVPGMATSVENIGFNRSTANALGTRYSMQLIEELGAAFYRTYGEVVGQIPGHHLRSLGPREQRDRMLELSGWLPPADPWQQLWASLDALVALAQRPRALTHRRRTGAAPRERRITVEVVEPTSVPRASPPATPAC